ncbi:MAG TPA: PAS domain-containing protein [Verrucomicrobiae bacterium]|nr:PAS domain-containing protein [Verrucomicrobiae bacterium]
MNRISRSSSRVRLVLVVLLAVVPSLALIYYNSREQRDAAIAQAHEDVARIARLAAAENAGVFDGVHQLLVALAQFPELRGDDPVRGGTVLGKLLEESRFYSDLGVAMPDGHMFYSAATSKDQESVAGRQWFQQAMKTRDFTVGEYQAGGSSGRPSLNFGYPIVGPGGQVQRVLFASLDLNHLTRQISLALPPEGVELALVDRGGVVLAQTGASDNRVGHIAVEAAQIKEVSSYHGRGSEQRRDSTGVEHIYAFYPIGGKHAGADAYVIASMPTAIAFTAADRGLRKSLVGLALVTLLALVAAWYGGEAIVLRQTNDELEQRVQERTRELAHEQFLLRTLLDNVPDSIYFKDSQGRFLRSSSAQTKRFGLSDPAQAIGKTDFDFFAKEHAEEAFADERQIIQTGQPLIGMEESSPLADGTERWVSTSKLPLRDKDGNIVGTFGISREITDRKRAEQALAKEHNVLHTLVDNLPDLVFVKDLKGRYVFDNAAHRAFLGVSILDEVIGKTVFDFYPRELASPLHADDEAVLAAGVPLLHREEDLTDRSGRKARAVTSKIPYRDEHHMVVGLVCISRLLGGPK